MDGRAYNKLSDGKLIGVFNRTGRKVFDYISISSPVIVLLGRKGVICHL